MATDETSDETTLSLYVRVRVCVSVCVCVCWVGWSPRMSNGYADQNLYEFLFEGTKQN